MQSKVNGKKIDFYDYKQMENNFRFSSKSLNIFKKKSLFLNLKQTHPILISIGI
jgi:hypothetical protein